MTEMLPGIMNAFSRRRAILAPFGGIVLEHNRGLQSLTISAHKIYTGGMANTKGKLHASPKSDCYCQPAICAKLILSLVLHMINPKTSSAIVKLTCKGQGNVIYYKAGCKYYKFMILQLNFCDFSTI